MKGLKCFLILVALFLILLVSLGFSSATKEVYIGLSRISYEEYGGRTFDFKINGVWAKDFEGAKTYTFSSTIKIEVFELKTYRRFFPSFGIIKTEFPEKLDTIILRSDVIDNGNCIGYIYDCYGPKNNRTEKLKIWVQDSNSDGKKFKVKI